MWTRLALIAIGGVVGVLGSQPFPAFAQGGGITPGNLKLTVTFNSIGVELPFTGDDNANATAALDFRKASDQDWRGALPLWRTDSNADSFGRAFYGSALLLDPGTVYEIRITLSDPDGVSGKSVLTGETSTRPEDISDASSIAPTFYVAVDGDDSNDGMSGTHAWRTLDKVVKAAPPGAIVDVGPGHFAAPAQGTIRNTPLTLKAHNAAVVQQIQSLGGEQRPTVVEANAGARSVVEPYGSDGGPAVSAPPGAQDPDLVNLPVNRIAPWHQVTLQGVADPSQSYTVWKWTGSPVTTAPEMGFATGRDDAPTRIANWFASAGDETPQKWAEQVYTNPDWHSGFWASDKDGRQFVDENGQDATTNRVDIYLRLPGDANPNDGYITVSGANMSGIIVNGPDIRVSGLEFRTNENGVELRSNATRAVIDRCLFQIGYNGVTVRGLPVRKTAPAAYGSDHVVQGNLFRDNSITSSDLANNPAIPWHFIKDDPAKLGRSSETAGIAGSGGAQRMVIRWNTFDGSHDGVSGFHAGYDRYSMQDADIYANYFKNLGDDAVEPSRGSINYRVWNNRMEQVDDVFSIAAPTWGPVYFFRNEAWRFGNQLVPRTADGRVPGGQAVKYGAADYRDNPPPARVYILLNTFWSDETTWEPAQGIVRAGDAGKNQPFIYLRDNIVRVANKAARIDAPAHWDEDADDFSTSSADQAAVVQTPNGRFRSDVGGYRANTGQGAHTNTRADFATSSDPEFMDSANGDLRLTPGSSLLAKGVPIPNVADRPGIDFGGAAPDLGAVQTS